MKNIPIWLDGIEFEKPKKLEEDIDVDVLIIGGGITGLSLAYHLINSKLKVCVVEQNIIAHQTSARTTGKLTYLQDNIYSKLKSKSKEYYDSQKDAINMVKNIINKNNIECDLEKVESYLFTDKKSDISKIKEEQNMLDILEVKYKTHNKLINKVDCKYAISVEDTYVFHPVKYLVSLKKIIEENNIMVHENSSVLSVDKKNGKFICEVNDKVITAKKLVIASHYPFFLFPLLAPIKVSLEKSYVSASKIDDIKALSAITVCNPVKSLRYYKDKDNYFIYLNGSHNLCINYNDKDKFKCLIDELLKMNLNPNYIWSNHDIMTDDKLPYIGYLDDNLLIGTGYNTWGMTNGSLAGKILSDLILNKKNKYKELFDPKRNKKIKDIIKYPFNMSCSAKSVIDTKLIKNKYWYDSNVVFTKKNGKNVGIYIDDSGKEHVVYNLCPHLKCSLIFNEVEKTWDCPCHGSRFDMDGKCIFGPSNKDIGYKD